MEHDLYEVLGILPSAEDIVITAAYRVLAQRYHPDRWTGRPAEAHERMSAINRAYETLKNPARRAAYDAQRTKKSQASYEQQQDQGREDVFSQAMNDLEARWKIAASVFPDLDDLRAKLAKLSSALAFSFVTVILERRSFKDRQTLADHMQDMFLGRYFGTDPKINMFAKELIYLGARDAARRLNELIDVLGSDIPSDLIISKIYKEYSGLIMDLENNRVRSEKYKFLLEQFHRNPNKYTLYQLCKNKNYAFSERGQGIFKPMTYEIIDTKGQKHTFNSKREFVAWGLREFKR